MEDRAAENIIAVDKSFVFRIIGIAFGTETQDAWVIFIGDNLHDPVGDDHLLAGHVGDHISGLQILGILIRHVDQRAYGKVGFHRAGEDRIHIESNQPDTHKCDGQKDRQHHENCGTNVPDFFNSAVQRFGLLLS